MKKSKIKYIENIEFEQIGDLLPYKLKHIKIEHPFINVHGLIKIDGEYFEKKYFDKYGILSNSCTTKNLFDKIL